MSRSREKNFVVSAMILSVGTFLPKLASFVTLPIYTAYLTKAEYGTFDLIHVLCSLVLPVATLQIQSAAFRFLLKKEAGEKRVRSIITNLYLFVFPVSVAVLFVAYFLMFAWSPVLRLGACLYYFFDILLAVTRQIARGLSKNKLYSISAAITSTLNIGLVVLSVMVLRAGLIGVVFSLATSVLVSFVYIALALKIWRYCDPKAFDKALFREMVAYAWPMVPNSMSLWVMRMSDRFLITLFLGVEANAVYAVANKIPAILQLAQNTFAMAWSENASIANEDADVDEYYSSMFHTIYRVLFGVAAMLIATLPLLFTILIRGDYDDAYIHIPILINAMFYSSVSVYLAGIYIAEMKTKSIGVTTMIAATINFVFNIAFIRVIGVYAATLSTAISYLVLMIYRLINVNTFRRIHFHRIEIITTCLILIGMTGLCFKRTLLMYGLNFIIGSVVSIFLNRTLIVTIGKTALAKAKKKTRKNP